MDNQDQPLGAPHLQNNTEEETKTSSKRKLNWKGFGIGIIAVIIIEFIAITALQSGDPQIQNPTQPTPTITPTTTITPSK